MKTILYVLLVCGMLCPALAQAQNQNTKHHHKKKEPNAGTDTNATPQSDPAADQAKQVAEYQKTFVPTDPWRVMNEKTNFAKGPDWVQFEGTVRNVTTEGIVMQGTFGEPLFYLLPHNGNATTGTFLLAHYPRRVAIGQVLSRNDRLVAMKGGSKEEWPMLDYGSVYVPELTEAQKAQVAQAKSSADAKVLAWHKELAEKGDAYGEYKMGMRYLNGNGVEKDPAKAKDFLTKAAAQGNKDAADALAKMPTSN